MRHFQKPVESSESSIITALIECLSPERRRELLAVAAQSRMLELIDTHQKGTVEAFLHAVQSDPHWSVLKDLLVSDVIALDRNGTSETQSEATAASQNASSDDARQMQLPSVSKNGTPEAVVDAAPAERPTSSQRPRVATPRKAASPARNSSGDILYDIVMAITLEPGLRSEEIQRRLGKPAVLVKSALIALRKIKRVRTEGANRATRYFLLAAK